MQGVSRSCTVTIAYLMYRYRMDYMEASAGVKGARGICSPNTGFIYQLLGLQSRLGIGRNAAGMRPRVYRVSVHHPEAQAHHLVLRDITVAEDGSDGNDDANLVRLDPRTAHVAILRAPPRALLWRGASCLDEAWAAARSGARDALKYDLGVASDAEAESLVATAASAEAFATAAAGSSARGLVGTVAEWDASMPASALGPATGTYRPKAPLGMPAMVDPMPTPDPPMTARGAVPAAADGTGAGADTDSGAGTGTGAGAGADGDGGGVGGAPRLFAFPAMDELTVFDTDDLDTDACFVLYSGGHEPSGSVFVWLGDGYAEGEDIDDDDDTAGGGWVPFQFFFFFFFLKKSDIQVFLKPTVVLNPPK
jgi:hypothetical protein